VPVTARPKKDAPFARMAKKNSSNRVEVSVPVTGIKLLLVVSTYTATSDSTGNVGCSTSKATQSPTTALKW